MFNIHPMMREALLKAIPPEHEVRVKAANEAPVFEFIDVPPVSMLPHNIMSHAMLCRSSTGEYAIVSVPWIVQPPDAS